MLEVADAYLKLEAGQMFMRKAPLDTPEIVPCDCRRE
jgi:hypothetical protein